MKQTTPYTYFIGWSSLNTYYYGVQYKTGCKPSNLFSNYFTSSKAVKYYIKEYGIPDIIQIRKIFKSKESALIHEHKVLRRLNVKHREDFLNRTNGRDWKQTSEGLFWIRNHDDPDKATKVKYIKSREEIPEGWVVGFKSQTDKQKKAASDWSSNYTHSEETKEKMSKAQSGNKNHRYGKQTSEETKEKIRERNSGSKNHNFKGYWVTPHGAYVTRNDACDYSPYKVSTDTLIKWCKSQNKKIISKNIYNLSTYLQCAFSKAHCIGKTFEEIGFGFREAF